MSNHIRDEILGDVLESIKCWVKGRREENPSNDPRDVAFDIYEACRKISTNLEEDLRHMEAAMIETRDAAARTEATIRELKDVALMVRKMCRIEETKED